MDPPTTVDEDVKNQMFDEAHRLGMENKALNEERPNLYLAVFDSCMELMVEMLKAKPELTREEVVSKIVKDYATWQKGAAMDKYGPLIAEHGAENIGTFGQVLFSLCCRLCWEYIQIYHPEKNEDCKLKSVYQEEEGYPIIAFVPEIVPKE